jgi:protease-4
VVPSQEIYQEVRSIREKGKKVVVSMGSVAASGGYYIAAASDKIVANPGTLTGSIGVIMELANVEGLLQKIGVQSVVIKSGRHKDIASPFRKMTPEERELIQKVLDDVHDQFIDAVAEGRSMQPSEVRALADGRIFTGRQAKEKGLVDELGGLQDAVRIAGEMIGARGEPKLVEPKKRFSIIDFLREEFFGGIASSALPGKTIRLSYLLSF